MMRHHRVQVDFFGFEKINRLLRAMRLATDIDDRNFLPAQFMDGKRDLVEFRDADEGQGPARL